MMNPAWKSDLEIMVENDMISKGYSPLLIEEIKKYWETMLDGD